MITLAASRGYEDAIKLRNVLAIEMSKEQVKKAEFYALLLHNKIYGEQ